MVTTLVARTAPLVAAIVSVVVPVTAAENCCVLFNDTMMACGETETTTLPPLPPLGLESLPQPLAIAASSSAAGSKNRLVLRLIVDPPNFPRIRYASRGGAAQG